MTLKISKLETFLEVISLFISIKKNGTLICKINSQFKRHIFSYYTKKVKHFIRMT